MKGLSSKQCFLKGIKGKNKGISLTEIIIAISIVVILSAFLLRGYFAVRSKSEMTTCLANLRTIGTATQLYILDHDGFMPGPYTSGQKLGYSLSRYSDRYHIPRVLGTYIGLNPATQGIQFASSIACPGWRANLGPQAEINPDTGEPNSVPAYLVKGNTLLIDGTRSNVWGYSAHGTEPKEYYLIEVPEKQIAISDIDYELIKNWKDQIPNRPVHRGKRSLLFFDFHVEALDGDLNL